MGTKSLIAKQISKNRYKAVLCATDGYLSHTGKILSENYTTPEKIDELLDLGELYWLGKKLAPADTGIEDKEATLAFARDFGEQKQDAQIFRLEELENLAQKPEYLYIYLTTGRWIYRGSGELENDYREVKKALHYLENVDSGETLWSKRGPTYENSGMEDGGPAIKL